MSELFISYAQNGEDVVLWRALSHVAHGRYVDVGANDPVHLSVTKALYDRGWRGIDIDAVPEYAEQFLQARPGNEFVQAAVTDRAVSEVSFHQLVGTGLSTLIEETAHEHEDAGRERREITVPAMTLDEICERSALLGSELHVLKIDVEGAEAEVLRSFDLERWRPWVVVVEATKPLSTESTHAEWDPVLVDAGYAFTLFDGLSRFYVSPDHPELVEALSYPACALDDFKRYDQQAAEEARDRAVAELHTWRNRAVGFWADAVARAQESENTARIAAREAERLQGQIKQMRSRLDNLQGDRQRLRERVRRLDARAKEMRERLDRQDSWLEARARRKARTVLRRVKGS